MEGGALLAHGVLWAFVSVFVGGFLTSLTPCVYPLIPITMSIFGGRGESSRGRAVALAACYVGGIGVMYASLGIFSALAGRAFGTYMASPWVMVPIAALFLAMAASMFGAFEVNLPSGIATRLASIGGAGFGGAFAMGLVGGIIAAPCTGPVLASVLAFVSTTRSVVLGASLLFTYALGMGVLFFAIAAFAVALPKSGRWMEAVKSFFGVVMIVGALYFLRNVAAPLRALGSASGAWLVSCMMLALVGLVSGALHLSFHDGRMASLRKAAGVLALSSGLFGGVAWALTPKVASQATELNWFHNEREGLARAQAERRPVLLDFYADWCLPCKELELKTFSDPEVARTLSQFALVKVDCTTDDDPVVVAAKKKYGADTLPTLAILRADGRAAARVDHFVKPAELLEILRKTL